MIKSYLWVSRLILSVLCSLMTCLQGKTVFFIFQRIKVISPGRPLVDKKKIQMKDHRGYTTQLKVVAKQSLKNIQASTELEPVTSAIPMKKSYECGV